MFSNMSLKHFHLEGLSKFHLVKFEATENIIKSISAGGVLFTSCVQIYTKTSKNIY